LARDCRYVRRDACSHKLPIEFFDILAILGHVAEQSREVEAKGAVELALDKTGRYDPAAEVDGLLG